MWGLARRRDAPTDTMVITPTRALLTDITGLTGSQAEYSSAPVRGMAGDAHGVGAAGVGAVDGGAVAGAQVGVTVAGVDAASLVAAGSHAVR